MHSLPSFVPASRSISHSTHRQREREAAGLCAISGGTRAAAVEAEGKREGERELLSSSSLAAAALGSLPLLSPPAVDDGGREAAADIFITILSPFATNFPPDSRVSQAAVLAVTSLGFEKTASVQPLLLLHVCS